MKKKESKTHIIYVHKWTNERHTIARLNGSNWWTGKKDTKRWKKNEITATTTTATQTQYTLGTKQKAGVIEMLWLKQNETNDYYSTCAIFLHFFFFFFGLSTILRCSARTAILQMGNSSTNNNSGLSNLRFNICGMVTGYAHYD